MQREVERREIPTVSVSVARDVTEHAKPPRAVFVPFMMGHVFGVPGHRELQRAILTAMLEELENVTASGSIRDLEYTWTQVRREAKAIR